MSFFITFEGGEGCGKSTQAKILHRRLTASSIPSALIYEPGGTPLGERVRRLLKQSRGIAISPLSELLLFNSSRSQLVTDVIRPGMKEGKIIICDRFTDSTIAYQHYGRGVEKAVVEEINALASQGCRPDLTFLLDVSPEIGLSRKRQGADDRFEREALEFHRRVRLGFLDMAAAEPGRWVVLDPTLPKLTIADLIWERVQRQLASID